MAAVGFVFWLNPMKDDNGTKPGPSSPQGTTSTRAAAAGADKMTAGVEDYRSLTSRWYRPPRLLSTLSIIREEEGDCEEYFDDDFEDASTMSSELEYQT
ncbi:hypothetical protein FOZ62_005265 [Perkinsus olseni]|uniref:Uncharacterized protein n=1 Tax=Perkinsus olseni TaxID=32597 RepID=A0A7J6SEM5_PEROL|nr:hypothetical protein FOZ62_005265 [Perkinsus olseni]